MNGSRIIWIDDLRGVSILSILYFHTEMYYVGHMLVDYNLYVVNVLALFYFLSGYTILPLNRKPFSWRHKLQSILRRLVWPYFFFTILLALPKAYANSLPLGEVLLCIVMGNGSWFVTSLVMAEVVFVLLLTLRRRWVIGVAAVAALVVAWLLTGSRFSEYYNYWNVHNAMIGFWFLCLGWLFRQCERRLSWLFTPAAFMLLLLLVVGVKLLVIHYGVTLIIEPVYVSSYPVFIIDTALFILMLLSLIRQVPHVRLLSWFGKRSLVVYFFCGAIPFGVSLLMTRVGMPYNGRYLPVFLVFVLVVVVAAVVSWAIYRYAPQLTGRRQSL